MAESDLSYERAVQLFDEKLEQLEAGNLTLEEALRATDEASVYLRAAERRLEDARRRIEVRPPDEEAPEPGPMIDPGPTEEELPF
ncbi:MAG TPA: exodeoxyribonuclease VII small subunit [Candidatus Dormibacteraeota bacterium]|jgi:exodeoxyribonuclease VII small subunit|nr:exodeoxyribonuclease VII small subunit [Candidatus Dormibacteraeota bacterium]